MGRATVSLLIPEDQVTGQVGNMFLFGCFGQTSKLTLILATFPALITLKLFIFWSVNLGLTVNGRNMSLDILYYNRVNSGGYRKIICVLEFVYLDGANLEGAWR